VRGADKNGLVVGDRLIRGDGLTMGDGLMAADEDRDMTQISVAART
jgi:hypothetical protein